MSARSNAYSIEKPADTFVCRNCGQSGAVIWVHVSRLGAPRRAASEKAFLERLGSKPPYPIELVCRHCGDVALTAFPSTSLHHRAKYN